MNIPNMYIPSKFFRIKSSLQKKQKRAYVRIQSFADYTIRFHSNQYSIYLNTDTIFYNYLPAQATLSNYIAQVDKNTTFYISYIQCVFLAVGEQAQIKIYNADTNELIYNYANVIQGFRYDFQPEKYYYIEVYYSS